jgi:hypothetical protein
MNAPCVQARMRQCQRDAGKMQPSGAQATQPEAGVGHCRTGLARQSDANHDVFCS